jgi:hypothetical protein
MKVEKMVTNFPCAVRKIPYPGKISLTTTFLIIDYKYIMNTGVIFDDMPVLYSEVVNNIINKWIINLTK